MTRNGRNVGEAECTALLAELAGMTLDLIDTV